MRRFAELVDSNVFANKRIALVENGYTDVTFMIEELMKIMNLQKLISFYKNKTYYDHISADINTIFESQCAFTNNTIVDDFYTAYTLFGAIIEHGVCVYRSDSFDYKWTRGFDLLIVVSPLESGFSTVYDGTIKIMDRDIVYYEFKYKVNESIGLLK
ncbi:hypothetical protein THOM_2826 [Trachipleistophora hominis]|uniref:Uncharacterized protein n=1 Tax=Trachipleistophora hominis TaxID=72359 RepID=L7JS59_TRAHO|nr:hypothetical protein THOM_2826 [Trachipleistophora hominis]